MNFELSDEHIMLRRMIQEFAKSELEQSAAARDEAEEWDIELWHKLAELGAAGISLPESYGGAGADYVSYMLTLEELAKVDASISMALFTHCSLVSWPILQFGSIELKQKFLPALAHGSGIGAFCLREEGSQDDPGDMQTTALLCGDDWIINGNKHFVINGGCAQFYLVFAQTSIGEGYKGVSAFVIENDCPGLTIGQKISKLGIRSVSTTSIEIHNCRIPKENLLGSLNEGYALARQIVNTARIAMAAQAIGIAQGAMERAVTYAKERIQFGKPIASMQAIQFMLADMATQIEAARMLVYQSAWSVDQDHLEVSDTLGQIAGYHKFACQIAMEVATGSVQIHGGYGYMKEYSVERYMRDAKFMQLDDALTNLIMRSDVGTC